MLSFTVTYSYILISLSLYIFICNMKVNEFGVPRILWSLKMSRFHKLIKNVQIDILLGYKSTLEMRMH